MKVILIIQIAIFYKEPVKSKQIVPPYKTPYKTPYQYLALISTPKQPSQKMNNS